MKVQNLPKTRAFLKPKDKQYFPETDIESSCTKSVPREFQCLKKKKQIRKKGQAVKLNKKQVFHERIHRFRIKNTRKTMRIYEYKESDLGWPKKYTKQLCPQEMDNDVESDSEIIEFEIEKCKRNLLQQIEKRNKGKTSKVGCN